jgi:hypothetical protein
MPSMPLNEVAPLEVRDVPAGLAESFDSAPLYFAPAGWQQWSSNGSQYYSVMPSNGVSGSKGVAVYGNTNLTTRLWKADALSSNVAVSISVRADVPAPILLLSRGSNLSTATPSFVAASISPGGTISLRETKNGSDLVLKSVTPSNPVGNAWLRITLETVNTTATVIVERLDTNQFLSASGTWQSAKTAAITQAVTWNPSTGVTGLGRLSGPYGTANVDQFTATPIVSATPAPLPTVPPPVSPPAPPPVSPPAPIPQPIPPTTDIRKYDHIRIAQLAYAAQPITATERSLIASSVDLVVSNPNFLNTFETASPTTDKVVYSNVSNLYLDLLSDWLGHADAINTDPEAAFYHVKAATPFTGSSPSAQPVTWFWSGVKSSSTAAVDVTSSLRSGTGSGVVVGTTGESLAIGHIDQFREINITLNRAAATSFNGVWEYAAAVNSSGTVTQWKTLSTLSDSTNRFRVNGRVTFNPPSDWVRGSVAGQGPEYFVRYRVTAGTTTTAPIVKTMLGRDYVQAGGTTTGTIPAFDTLADANSDGYLSDSEFASRRSGFEARFVHESRLFYPFYGQMRFVVNPTSDAVKAWAADYHEEWFGDFYHADGIFLDNASGKLPFNGSLVIESTADYSAQSAALVDAVREALDDDAIVVANTTGSRAEGNGIAKAAGIAFEEFALRPNSVNWSGFNDMADLVTQRLASDPDTRLVLDSHSGTASLLDARTRIGVLSYYYLLADPERTYLMAFGGQSPSSSWTNRWIPAAAVDVGSPTGSLATFANGNDPADSRLEYRVFGRTYENALVLFKPLSYKLGVGTGTNANATATTHALGGSYRVLHADGSVGPVVTSITLRNGEGAVLIKS